MRKVVSTDEGYTLFFEKNGKEIDCIAYETGIHMSGQDIGDIIGISKGAVSQSLKKSIKRLYYYFKNIYRDLSVIEIMSIMANIFNVKTDNQYKKFFRLFPTNIQGEMYAEGYERGYYSN